MQNNKNTTEILKDDLENIMNEHKKRNEIMHECYEACKNMNFNDTFDLFENTDNENEKDFFRIVSDFFLQQKQKKGSCRKEILMKKYLIFAGVNGAELDIKKTVS